MSLVCGEGNRKAMNYVLVKAFNVKLVATFIMLLLVFEYE